MEKIAKKQFILAIDLGTTSIRTLAYDTYSNEFININQRKIKQYYPQPSWVEQDANEIMSVINYCLKKTVADLPQDSIYGLGLTNQRETIVAWQKSTGKPLANAIVWQCRRTHELCEQLKQNKRIYKMIRSKTGLFPDSYFSATKIAWLLQNNTAVQEALKNNDLCVGTLDSFVVFNLTNGQSFITDTSNASRTLLFNITTQDWDNDLLQFFDIPREILPNVVASDCYVGDTIISKKKIAIGGILGDQQASLLGQCCTNAGEAKTTFGTGAFMLCNIGKKPVLTNDLITTIAWTTRQGTSYAFEGNMYSAGACINWLIDRLAIIDSAKESETLAKSVPDNGGVYFVPALSGLGAPFWKSNARAQFHGLTLATTDAHLVRAVLASIAYNTRAVFDSINSAVNLEKMPMRVDGGMTANSMFIQYLSNILHSPISVSAERESTSLGACFMCGLAFGAFDDLDSLHQYYHASKTYTPAPHNPINENHYLEWLKLIEKC